MSFSHGNVPSSCSTAGSAAGSAARSGLRPSLLALMLAIFLPGCVPKNTPDEGPVVEATPPPTRVEPATTPADAEPLAPAATADEPAVAGDAAPSPAASAPPQPAASATSAFAKAEKALALGEPGYREALSHLDEATRLDPSYTQAWFNRGVVLQRMGRLADAESSYQKALDINPDFIPAYVNLASVMREQGQHDRALDILDRARKKAPGNSQVGNERVAVLRSMGRVDDAIAEAHRLIKENSNDLNAFINLAIAYYDQGNLEMSRLVFEKAFASFPDVSSDAHVRHAYGLVVLKQGERDLAIVTGFDKALELEPKYVDALINRAQLHLEDSEPKKAAELLRRAVEEEPRNTEARLSLAVALRRSGDLDAAKAQYEILIDQAPSSFDAVYNLAVLYSNYLSDPARAKEYFERARKLTESQELIAQVDQYIAEAQRNIETQERTEKLRRLREQAAQEKAAREAAEKAAQGGGEGGEEGASPDDGAPPDEGADPSGDPPPPDEGADPSGDQPPPDGDPPPEGGEPASSGGDGGGAPAPGAGDGGGAEGGDDQAGSGSEAPVE